MKKALLGMLCAVSIAGLSGCTLSGGTDLSEVARSSGLDNVTTGDGTFENYTATGHHTSTEIGIAVGLPGLVKLMELYPAKTNEELLQTAADAAAADGANAMINVTPHKEVYYGLPFIIVGLYVDKAEGTGIDAGM